MLRQTRTIAFFYTLLEALRNRHATEKSQITDSHETHFFGERVKGAGSETKSPTILKYPINKYV